MTVVWSLPHIRPVSAYPYPFEIRAKKTSDLALTIGPCLFCPLMISHVTSLFRKIGNTIALIRSRFRPLVISMSSLLNFPSNSSSCGSGSGSGSGLVGITIIGRGIGFCAGFGFGPSSFARIAL